MDKKLRTILEEFSVKLQNYEEGGGDLPQDVDDVWATVTDILMEE
jgi:hypothetical protein